MIKSSKPLVSGAGAHSQCCILIDLTRTIPYVAGRSHGNALSWSSEAWQVRRDWPAVDRRGGHCEWAGKVRRRTGRLCFHCKVGAARCCEFWKDLPRVGLSLRGTVTSRHFVSVTPAKLLSDLERVPISSVCCLTFIRNIKLVCRLTICTILGLSMPGWASSTICYFLILLLSHWLLLSISFCWLWGVTTVLTSCAPHAGKLSVSVSRLVDRNCENHSQHLANCKLVFMFRNVLENLIEKHFPAPDRQRVAAVLGKDFYKFSETENATKKRKRPSSRQVAHYFVSGFVKLFFLRREAVRLIAVKCNVLWLCICFVILSIFASLMIHNYFFYLFCSLL